MNCITFKGFKDRDGYGVQQVRCNDGKWRTRGAHRVAYCLHSGIALEDIEGLVILHTCDNPSCVNPDHLRLGTQLDNIKDMYRKGRQSDRVGSNNPNAKLDSATAQSIRSDYLTTKSYSKLSIKYGVGRSTIARVIRGETFK